MHLKKIINIINVCEKNIKDKNDKHKDKCNITCKNLLFQMKLHIHTSFISLHPFTIKPNIYIYMQLFM